MARLTRPALLLPLCFALGLLFDVLLWDQRWGISFTLFIMAAAGLGLWQAARLKLQPARRSWWLLAAALGFAAVSAVRTEPYTLLFTRGFSILMLMLFAADLLAGQWLHYRFSDFFVKLAGLVPAGWMAAGDYKAAGRGKKPPVRPWVPVLRGLLLAVPVLLVLAALLASADVYFGNWLTGLLSFLQIERLPEYIARLVLISIVALAAYGAYTYAFLRSSAGAAKDAVVKPFIGFTEALMVLGSVAVLLASFVVFQFQHFFGGAENIIGPDGYTTYAEYARRGFAELCMVAVIVLVLFILLSSLSRRSKDQQSYFSGFGVLLFALVAVVLASAFQRLLLYEQAYGFTSMRLLPHIFMVWLGILLLALVVMELTGRQRSFAAAVLLAAAGFVATLPILNLDAYSARANIAHGLQTAPQNSREQVVDHSYLASLSPDAVPALVEGFLSQQAAGNHKLAQQLAAALACIAYVHDGYGAAWQDWALARQIAFRQGWRDWTLARQQAAAAWQHVQAQPSFPSVSVAGDSVLVATVDGVEYLCNSHGW